MICGIRNITTLAVHSLPPAILKDDKMKEYNDRKKFKKKNFSCGVIKTVKPFTV
jgi:hypothetical protein